MTTRAGRTFDQQSNIRAISNTVDVGTGLSVWLRISDRVSIQYHIIAVGHIANIAIPNPLRTPLRVVATESTNAEHSSLKI
jgi:hypothetical protein